MYFESFVSLNTISTLFRSRIFHCIQRNMYSPTSCTIKLSIIKHQVSFPKLINERENYASYESNIKSSTSGLPYHVTINVTIKE